VPRTFRIGFACAVLLLLVTAGSALAITTTITIDNQAVYTRETVTLTGTIECTAGAAYHIRASVDEGKTLGARHGNGETFGACLSDGIETWSATLYGGPFRHGTALAMADANICLLDECYLTAVISADVQLTRLL
jgi:hypothetical protein